MALTEAQIAEQKKQAEELLFSGPERLGFAKSLFFGKFPGEQLWPAPKLRPEEKKRVDDAVQRVRQFAEGHIDAAEIDQNADIPQSVIAGLSGLGVLGMTAPAEFGGAGFSQQGYCKIMEVLGGHCASTAVFVNAHHSIGIRALVLFGTEAQKRRWLPDLVAGRKLAAFALTEPEAGSDAANVQTTAVPSPDGKTWFLTGEKRYITNGAIADILTVMARTPVPGTDETKVTAFLVTPDMPGFQVTEARMPKCGIRGTATARLAFRDMPVPAENVLGPLGKGLRVALTVLDFGRVTFGASCTGAAKACVEAAVRHANRRVQFKEPIGEFQLVKKKIANMAAHAFAMEATTTECARVIDSGVDDYMLETAILKVFATDQLWTIVNDTLQIHGGQGYFSNEPYERWMRDARINTIGEGANEVLKAFISVLGLRAVGESLRGVLAALQHPWAEFGSLFRFGKEQISARWSTPEIPVVSPELIPQARLLAERVREFGLAIPQVLSHFRSQALARKNGKDEELAILEVVLKSQYMHERLADAVCDLYASSCTLSRLDSMLAAGGAPNRDVHAGRYFLRIADRRIRRNLVELWDNVDDETTATADAFLKG